MLDNNSTTKLEILNEYETIKIGEETQIHSLVSLTAPELEEKDEDKRDPIDVAIVVDRSGSMSGTPISLVKKALLFIVQHLKKDDRLSIVSYSNNVTVDVELQYVDTDAKRQNVINTINQIRAGGSTNLSGGLKKALTQMNLLLSEQKRVKSIFLLTDGMANCGLSNPQTVNMVTKDYNQLCQKCSINTFGFSPNHDSAFLQQIAEAGNGSYFFIKDADAIGESFVSAFGGLVSVVSKDVKLSIEVLKPDWVSIEQVRTAYSSTLSEGKKATINLFDLQSEESRDILVKLKFTKNNMNEQKLPILLATLDYHNTMTQQHETKKTMGYIQTATQVVEQQPNERVRKELNRVLAAETMENVKNLCEKKDFKSAQKFLDDNLNQMRQSSYADQDMLTEMEQCNDFLSPQAYSSGGGHQIASNMHGWGRQRANATRQKSMSKYSNKKKKKMLSLFSKA